MFVEENLKNPQYVLQTNRLLFHYIYYNGSMNTKQNSQQKYSMFLWLFLALLFVAIFLSVFFFTRNTPSDPFSSNPSNSSSVTNEHYANETESPIDSSTGSKPTQDSSSVSSGDIHQQVSIQNDGTHIVPKEPVNIEIPTPPLGDVEEIPNYTELLRLNDLQSSYNSLLSYLEELQEELKNNPSDRELKALIKETKDALEKIQQEKESILNGDF
jgi:hypothetical protein